MADELYTKLDMLRIFYDTDIQFMYIMKDLSIDKYRLVNFSKNRIEQESFDSTNELYKYLDDNQYITKWQKI